MVFARFRSDLQSWVWRRTAAGRAFVQARNLEEERYGLPTKGWYWPVTWLVLSFVHDMVRWMVVRDIDPNEDFNCVYCSKPVLRRWLYCSDACGRADDLEHVGVLKEHPE